MGGTTNNVFTIANANGAINSLLYDATTTGIATALTLGHHSTATPATGFGSSLQWQLDSDTTANRIAAERDVLWVTATDASRKTRVIDYVYDTAARELLRGEASGTAPMIGFLGASAVVRQATTGTTQQTTAGTGTTVKTDSTTTGGTGSTAYTLSDIVLALKNYGLLTS